MVEGNDIEVASTQLAPAEPVDTSTGERFIHFQTENLPRGAVVDLSFSDLSKGNGLPYVILWAIVAVVIIGIAAYLMKRTKGEDTGE